MQASASCGRVEVVNASCGRVEVVNACQPRRPETSVLLLIHYSRKPFHAQINGQFFN